MANSLLLISVRPLDSQAAFHGKRDGGEPEWPPSPLRLFQAFVDASASRWNGSRFDEIARPALELLQGVTPEIVTPMHNVGTPFRTAVPNNDLDAWAGPISKGNEPKKQPNELKTMKTIQPIRIREGDGRVALNYVYPLPELPSDKTQDFINVLGAAARSITHLGWGVDMVAADAKVISQEDADKLPGHRWRVVPSGGVSLRVPKAGTLTNLMEKHQAFLGRLSADGFKPVLPLSCFDVVSYHSPTAGVRKLPEKPFAAFQILAPDASKVLSFSVNRGVRDVAAWARKATSDVCVGWPFDDVGGFVHGHDPNDTNKPLKGESADARFSYLPLPSIERRGDRGESVGRIRRLIISAPLGFEERVDWVRRRLTGQELLQEQNGKSPEAVGLLNLLPTSDWVLRQYTGAAMSWSTVTPVLLPGYDDRDLSKAEELLREALGHAGLPREVVGCSELEFGRFGFRRGLESVREYMRPDNLKKFPAYHVRVKFPHPVAGPLAVGAGRYRGFGLFAAESAP